MYEQMKTSVEEHPNALLRWRHAKDDKPNLKYGAYFFRPSLHRSRLCHLIINYHTHPQSAPFWHSPISSVFSFAYWRVENQASDSKCLVVLVLWPAERASQGNWILRKGLENFGSVKTSDNENLCRVLDGIAKLYWTSLVPQRCVLSLSCNFRFTPMKRSTVYQEFCKLECLEDSIISNFEQVSSDTSSINIPKDQQWIRN